MTRRAPIERKSIRVSDDLWTAAKGIADERGEVLSEEIRKFLEQYVTPAGTWHTAFFPGQRPHPGVYEGCPWCPGEDGGR